MQTLWNTIVFFFGGVVGAIIGIAVESLWERFRTTLRFGIDAWYHDFGEESFFLISVSNQGFDTVHPIEATLSLDIDATPLREPLVSDLHLLSETGEKELLTGQTARFRLPIKQSGVYVCPITAFQARRYMSAPESALYLTKYDSTEIVFSSVSIGMMLLRCIAACEDGSTYPPRELVENVYHWPDDIWEEINEYRRMGRTAQIATLVWLLLIIGSLAVLIGG